MIFHCTIIQPRAHKFSHAFDEVVDTLVYGLRALGHTATFRPNFVLNDAQNIVLGAHMCAPDIELPQGTILYNLEQLETGFQIPPDLAKRYRIWDYSPCNLGLWHQQGIEAEYVPIGYMPEMTRIVPTVPDIDVLFYGCISPRRKQVLEELEALPGIKSQIVSGFGSGRDHVIARSKVILNMHFHDSPGLFEIVRVSYLLSNSKAVVSEHSKDFPLYLTGAMRVAHYRDLATTCRELVEDNDARATLEQEGFKRFARWRESEILRVALGHL